MTIYQAPFYTETQKEGMEIEQMHFPFSDKDATYDGLYHQYELTNAYFIERGRNPQAELEGTDPERVNHFLKALRTKIYSYIYTHNQSTVPQMNYMIAVKGLNGYDMYSYRQIFLEAMFIEGCYLLDNGDISSISGVDFDTMQNMSEDVMRNQDRDMHKDCIRLLNTLGLNYYGKYKFIPQGQGKEW